MATTFGYRYVGCGVVALYVRTQRIVDRRALELAIARHELPNIHPLLATRH